MHTTTPQPNEASKANSSAAGKSAAAPLRASQSTMQLATETGEETDAMQLRQNPLQPKENHQNPLQPVSYSNPFQRKENIQNPLRPITYSNPFHSRANGQNPLQTTDYSAIPLQRKEVTETGMVQPKKENNTGLPDNLKAGVEALSGYSMDDVKVHYNSDKPAQLQALAYAQGTDIHIAPGQEQHLPHEAWHVVQQKQGRVQPTVQMKQSIAVNDDKGLENEADVMGEKAVQRQAGNNTNLAVTHMRNALPQIVAQRYTEENGLKISENRRFAVKNEGENTSEMFVQENVQLAELKEAKFVTGSKAEDGWMQVKPDLKMEPGEIAAIHCGAFSAKMTGIKENVENETAPVGRSLFIDNIGWSEDDPNKATGNWANHYAPVIINDGDDRGTFETAVHVDHAWFGIYGQQRGQTFRLKTVQADIVLAEKRKLIKPEEAQTLLEAIDNYIKTGDTNIKDKYLQSELEKISSLASKENPDLDSKFREAKEKPKSLRKCC